MDREYGPEQAAHEARWARNLAELHYHPVQVFSPYQMLKVAYQLKGYEAMLADYAGTSFIFDEIHAYEPERLAMILEFVRYLRDQLSARFFIMSATMPRIISRRVKEVLRNPHEVRASDELFESFTRHLIHLVRGEILSESAIEQIQKTFNQRKSVRVTCNTVDRAQEAYRRLQSKLPPHQVVLIHGRFNGRDRLRKEGDILAATGLKSRERRSTVVVSTQVVEVSLNIDLDVLFSDPAPLEALVQRLGRINRNRRADLAPAYIFSDPVDGQGVYLSKLVQAALSILQKYADGVPLRECLVGVWLDEIYNGDILDEWDQKYTNASRDFREAFLLNLRPFCSDDTLTQAFDRLFDGTEVLPLSLQEEYRTLREERPIEASQLLVSISWRRWKQLQRANSVRSEANQWPPVVDVPYSSELGLAF